MEDYRKEFSEILERMSTFVGCSYKTDAEANCPGCCCRSSLTGKACIEQMKIDHERLVEILTACDAKI